MRAFGGTALLLDRDDINTDEIIPAKYLTEITKMALKPHLLEDLVINDEKFDNHSPQLSAAHVIISRKNFGCGSSREHAVWAFEVNDINVVIAESFARIFRQNMFNCGILAIELAASDISDILAMPEPVTIQVDVAEGTITAGSTSLQKPGKTYHFILNDFDRELVSAGGWLEYAEKNY